MSYSHSGRKGKSSKLCTYKIRVYSVTAHKCSRVQLTGTERDQMTMQLMYSLHERRGRVVQSTGKH